MPDVKLVAHRIGGVTFLLALGIALGGGLLWALNPDETERLTITGGEVADPAATPTPTEAPDAIDDPETPLATPTPTPTPTPTEDPEELIAAAREPSATTVQVLEAGSGMSVAEAAAAFLRDELDYQVINVTSARIDVEVTTVLYTDGHEDEARALRARDARVAEVDLNDLFNEGTDLHLLVGPDWDD